jgi:hypothetical protein
MANLRGIQATNSQTFAGTANASFPVTVLSAANAAGKPYVIESVWLRVVGDVGQLADGAVILCKTGAVRFDVVCHNIFRPAGSAMTLFSNVDNMDYSVTIRWL